MRKLYNHTKGKIHPSPPPPSPSPSSTTSDHHLSLLPFAIATLAATLPPQDQQVLAYLLSISATTTNKSGAGKPTKSGAGAGDHQPQFNCNCFRCYTSFWVRWDASPNRKVIHEIIDAFEDGLMNNKRNGKNKKERKNNNNNKCSSPTLTSSIDLHAPVTPAENTTHGPPEMEQRKIDGEDEIMEKGSVRKIVNFIGERIWGVWGV